MPAAPDRVLLIDSPHQILGAVELALRDERFTPVPAPDPAGGGYAAAVAVAEAVFDDPGVRAVLAAVPTVYLAARPTERAAARRLGVPDDRVYGYPGADPREIAKRVRAEARAAAERGVRPAALAALLGREPSWETVRAAAERVAAADCDVLLVGPTGSGKTTLARLIHTASGRSGQPFETADLPAVPQPLHAAELFGHVRGAFTGADRDRAGLFARAGAGTLLLDELGELSAETQTALLRAVQDRVVRPVGGDADVRYQARLVFATNRNLGQAAQDGGFRPDLLYRLAPVVLRLPPLSARPADRLLIARAIARQATGREVRLAAETEQWIERYGWPGNVRELEQFIRGGAVFLDADETELRMVHFQFALPVVLSDNSPPAAISWPPSNCTLDEYEKRARIAYLAMLMRECGRNWKEIARRAGRNADRLREEAKKFGLTDEPD